MVNTIAVKNINCNFESLKKRIETICTDYKLEKDSFLFKDDGLLYERLRQLKYTLAKEGEEILVNKVL